MDDPLDVVFPNGTVETPEDGAVLVGLLTAEGPPVPGTGALVASLTAVALHCELDVEATATFVRGVRERYTALVTDTTRENLDEKTISATLGAAILEGIKAASNDTGAMEIKLKEGFPRYALILENWKRNAKRHIASSTPDEAAATEQPQAGS